MALCSPLSSLAITGPSIDTTVQLSSSAAPSNASSTHSHSELRQGAVGGADPCNKDCESGLSSSDGNGSTVALVQHFAVDSIQEDSEHTSVYTRSMGKAAILMITLAGVTIANSMSLGLYTIGMPRIASDLKLADNLLFWPVSVCALTGGCTLLLAGAVADYVGNRMMNLCGCFLLGIFILGSGLARTGLQVLIFRGLQGIATSLCTPTAFSILTEAFPHGRRRNVALSALGLSQPLGWSIGLLSGGMLEETVLGWRFGFYICAGGTIFLSLINAWVLPKDRIREPLSLKKLAKDIDWIGAAISSGCLGILSYVLAVVSGNLWSIHDASTVTLLCISAALMPAFAFWMNRQEKLGKPAFIPNSIWKNSAFAAICLMVILAWAVMQSMELFLSLYFRQVQLISVIQTSLRFLPNIILGIIVNIATGFVVNRIRADRLLVVSTLICAISPILMAIINVNWSWWTCAFWAVLLSPLCADVIFTVANLMVADIFPPGTQALAGAVFNTVAQLGTSIGIAVTAVIASSVTEKSALTVKTSPEALMEGYRIVFWVCFAVMISACAIGGVGLRKVGCVGKKRE